MDAEAAAAEPQAAPVEAVDPFDKAEAAILAREDAQQSAAVAKPDAVAKPNEPAKKPERKSPDIAALATREWKAQQTEQAAKKLQAKYAPLDELLGKRDLAGTLNHLAEHYGVTFADFVAVLNGQDEKPKEKTPAEVAAETVAAELRKRDEAAAKERSEADQRRIDKGISDFKAKAVDLAEKGDEKNPDRWELTAVSGKAEEAWDVVDGHFMATCKFEDGKLIERGETLSLEQALDLIEKKLREKQSARRPKTDAGKPKPGANRGNEAAATKADGKAGKPSFTNRRTSGAATVPVEDQDDPDESGSLADGSEIERAARKAGIRL